MIKVATIPLWVAVATLFGPLWLALLLADEMINYRQEDTTCSKNQSSHSPNKKLPFRMGWKRSAEKASGG